MLLEFLSEREGWSVEERAKSLYEGNRLVNRSNWNPATQRVFTAIDVADLLPYTNSTHAWTLGIVQWRLREGR